MSLISPPKPGPRVSDHRQVIPRSLLLAMAALAALSLVLVSLAKLTGRPPVAQVHTAAVVTDRIITIEPRADGGTRVLSSDGTVLSDTPSNVDGFITVVRNALEFERKRTGVTDNPPVHLLRFADGRVGLRDDASGWKISLVGFGQDNAGVWNALVAD